MKYAIFFSVWCFWLPGSLLPSEITSRIHAWKPGHAIHVCSFISASTHVTLPYLMTLWRGSSIHHILQINFDFWSCSAAYDDATVTSTLLRLSSVVALQRSSLKIQTARPWNHLHGWEKHNYNSGVCTQAYWIMSSVKQDCDSLFPTLGTSLIFISRDPAQVITPRGGHNGYI